MLSLSIGLRARPGPASPAGDPDRYMFAATRLALHTFANPAVTAGFEYQVSRVLIGTPDHDARDPVLFFANWRRQTGGATPTELTPGNVQTVRATLEIDGSFVPLDFGGAPTRQLADGETVAVPVPGLTIPRGASVFLRTQSQVPAGLRFGSGYRVVPARGEGLLHSASDQAALLGGGTIAGTGTSGHIYPAAAVSMVARGWDGRPVLLLLGDSIAWGQDVDFPTTGYFSDARGNRSYLQRALDDAASSQRMAYGNFAVPGVGPTHQDAASDIPRTLALLEHATFGSGASYRTPFTAIVSNMGVNAFGTGTGASEYPGLRKPELEAAIGFIRTRFPGKRYIQSTLTPRAAQTAGSSWTNPADQAPVGTDGTFPNGRHAFNADLLSGQVAGVDAVLDVRGAFADAVLQDRWKAAGRESTLAVAITGATASITVANGAAFRIGDSIAIGVGSTPDGRLVTGISGNALSLNTSVSTARPVGALVATRLTADGVHPVTTVHDDAAALVIARKNAGVFA